MSLFAAASMLFALQIGGAALALAACALFGISTGATFAFFNASVFGVVYGTLMSVYAIAAAIGPLGISAVFDMSGSYSPAFWAGVGAAALAAVMLSNLSPVEAHSNERTATIRERY